MQLVKNWTDVLKKSWSLRAVYAGLAIQAIDFAIKFLNGDSAGLDPATLKTVLGALGVAAAILRIISQTTLQVTPVSPPPQPLKE